LSFIVFYSLCQSLEKEIPAGDLSAQAGIFIAAGESVRAAFCALRRM
jgi:hypothetical protein